MAQSEVNQDGVDDQVQHLIHKRQAPACYTCAGPGTGPPMRNLTNALIAPPAATIPIGRITCYFRLNLAYDGACGTPGGATNLVSRTITNAPVIDGPFMCSTTSTTCLRGPTCYRYCYVPGILSFDATCGCHKCGK